MLDNSLKNAKSVAEGAQNNDTPLLGIRSDPNAVVRPTDGGPDCEFCGNKRFILDENGSLKPCSHCGVAEQWKVEALKPFSSLQGLALKQTFFNFKTEFEGKQNPHLRLCLDMSEEFAANPERHWLIIIGDRGTGKSHLCAAVANDLVHRNIPALFITMPDLLASLIHARELQANTEQETYSGCMNTFKTVAVLILDDLGAETATTWSDGVMFELLDYRYRNQLATMVATNLPIDEFDPRVASRMKDTALCTIVENAAPDYRTRPLDKR